MSEVPSDEYVRKLWELNKMRDTPKWQMSLLSLFPRPIAVLMIGTLRPLIRLKAWLVSEEGVAWIFFAFLFVIIPGAAWLLTHSWEIGAGTFLFVLLGLLVVILLWSAVEKITIWYRSIDSSLPRREKKDD